MLVTLADSDAGEQNKTDIHVQPRIMSVTQLITKSNVFLRTYN